MTTEPLAYSEIVAALPEALGPDPLPPEAIIRFLLAKRPAYGAGLAAAMTLGASGAPPRPVVDWLAEVAALYDAARLELLDGRLLILGLALLAAELQQALLENDFVQNLQVELERPFVMVLSQAGQDLAAGVGWIIAHPSMYEVEMAGGEEMLGPPDEVTNELTGEVDLAPGLDLGSFAGAEIIPVTGGGGGTDSFEPLPDGGRQAGEEETMTGSEPPDDFDELFEGMREPAVPGGDDREAGGREEGARGAGPQHSPAAKQPLPQARRLEAALPEAVKVGQTTELLVMVPRRDSPGLRAELPLVTEGGEVIDKQDVKDRETVIQFPAPDVPRVVYLYIQAAQHDFDVEDPFRAVLLYPDSDGDYEPFYLTPKRPAERAPVTVRLYDDEGRRRPLGSVRLATAITADEADLQHTRFREDIAYAAAAGAVTINYSYVGGDSIHAEVSDSDGVAIGGDASASIIAESGAADGGLRVARLFTPLLVLVAAEAPRDVQPAIIGHVQALQEEVERGGQARDEGMAELIESIAGAVPATRATIMSLFQGPPVSEYAGPVTRYIVKGLQQT